MSDARPAPHTYELVRALYLRVLGLVIACAFASLWVQADGLIGSRGILPLQDLLHFALSRLGSDAYWRFPTLLWIDSSDATLHFLCALGFGLGVILAVAAPRPAFLLALLWILYLSLVSVGDVFLGFQWDTLLLETCFFSVGFAAARPPRRIALFLLRWLLFRLLLLSGMVKLLSGDESWRDLSALTYHYWTQPLPTWTSAFVNDLPAFVHSFACAVTLGIELAAPFGIFGPRRLRLISCAAIALLQLTIALTGNYGFFNLLTLTLCIPLLDDRALRALVPSRFRERIAQPSSIPDLRLRPALLPLGSLVLAAFLFAVTSSEALERLDAGFLVPSPVENLLVTLAPLRTFNSYGLFAVMTKERPEILIEGSSDGLTWRPYEFRWKPGALDRRPRFTTPHMPRLDWQMWFAALGSCEREPWLHAFLRRLLEGNPVVSGLLSGNPFPDAPPRYLRSTLWKYRFSTPTDRRQGVWWTREKVGPYCPTVALDQGRLRVVREPAP